MELISLLRPLAVFSTAAVFALPVTLSAQQSETVQLSAAQLFELAARAEQEGNYSDAEQVYRALAHDPDPEIRTEARFRLALMLADRMGLTGPH